MTRGSTHVASTDPEWTAFLEKLDAAELEFAQGRADDFIALWSRADNITICGAFGAVESGRDAVAARLTWASSKFSEGTRTRDEVSGIVGKDLAYLVQNESIRYRIPGRSDPTTLHLRVTMAFRREADGWRIVHRHADSLMTAKAPE
jgi:ketosteroid isomerase-like protein